MALVKSGGFIFAPASPLPLGEGRRRIELVEMVRATVHKWLHVRSLYFRDPEENLLEFVCYDEICYSLLGKSLACKIDSDVYLGHLPSSGVACV